MLLLVVPLCLLGFTAAWGGLISDQSKIQATVLVVDDEIPEIGSVINFEVRTDRALEGQNCVILIGTTQGPTNEIPVGGEICYVGKRQISGTHTDFRIHIPNSPKMAGTKFYTAVVTIKEGNITSISNCVGVRVVDQEDIPG